MTSQIEQRSEAWQGNPEDHAVNATDLKRALEMVQQHEVAPLGLHSMSTSSLHSGGCGSQGRSTHNSTNGRSSVAGKTGLMAASRQAGQARSKQDMCEGLYGDQPHTWLQSRGCICRYCDHPRCQDSSCAAMARAIPNILDAIHDISLQLQGRPRQAHSWRHNLLQDVFTGS